jgi:hypothetical protein
MRQGLSEWVSLLGDARAADMGQHRVRVASQAPEMGLGVGTQRREVPALMVVGDLSWLLPASVV